MFNVLNPRANQENRYCKGEQLEWQITKHGALAFPPLLSKSDGRNRTNKDITHSWTDRTSSFIFVVFANLCKQLFEIESGIHSRPEDRSWRFYYYNFYLQVIVSCCAGCLEKQRKRAHLPVTSRSEVSKQWDEVRDQALGKWTDANHSGLLEKSRGERGAERKPGGRWSHPQTKENRGPQHRQEKTTADV